MKAVVVRAFGLFASVLVAGAAAAQSTQAVEWKVSEGGNGHWYQVRTRNTPIDYWALEQQIESQLRGHLATIQDAEEDNFVWSTFQPGWAYLGGYQDTLAADYSEPAGGWRWVTGEPFSVTPVPWADREPNNGRTIGVNSENFLGYHGPCCWNDAGNPDLASPGYVWSYVIEWEADCNGDGIVDYGQIKSGQLADDNANGVPDICELSVTGVVPPSVPSQGGSAITIKGNNFPENPVVLVGGLPANDVVRVSATRITAATPSLLPGMASVKVNSFTLEEALYIRPQCGSDLDQNGSVDTADIAIVLLDFGPCYVTATSPQADDSKPFMLQEQPAPTAPQSR